MRNFFFRQLATWTAAQQRFDDLQQVQTKTIGMLKAQFNPARIVSTGASIKKEVIAERPCFLCEKNRPAVQIALPFDDDFEILVNPFPILPIHFTIPSRHHQPQAIAEHYETICRLLEAYPEWMVFYNGPKCGASAPDHLHFQAGTSGLLPIQTQFSSLFQTAEAILKRNENEGLFLLKDYPFPAIALVAQTVSASGELFKLLYDALPLQRDDTEPMMNIVAWKAQDTFVSVVFPRSKHRPDCYYAIGEAQFLISPGALDMGGLFVLPRKEDYERVTIEKLTTIMTEIVPSSVQMEKVISKLLKHQ
ncbi:MAG: DUF4922 domain-containing protein [Prevotella sp.]|nr:DUF4922 domain-containing protein [Prevotella sp.]MDD7273437.1 DUF4922 domain-containing protein [Prevotellaceae bacterium]MDY3935887.1 DUF4922 domain-containing protein [Prevotella sp.]MDY4218195.1 DUF4922 domain-containing protein [Prevotella sp.]